MKNITDRTTEGRKDPLFELLSPLTALNLIAHLCPPLSSLELIFKEKLLCTGSYRALTFISKNLDPLFPLIHLAPLESP